MPKYSKYCFGWYLKYLKWSVYGCLYEVVDDTCQIVPLWIKHIESWILNLLLYSCIIINHYHWNASLKVRLKKKISIWSGPSGHTTQKNNVIITSKNDARRRFGVIVTLLLRRVPVVVIHMTYWADWIGYPGMQMEMIFLNTIYPLSDLWDLLRNKLPVAFKLNCGRIRHCPLRSRDSSSLLSLLL